MFDFSSFINLPLVWIILIATAIFMYILLDGFDLGVGILFPFASSDEERDKMMNSIAPFWDGNETWLVLSAGGLFVVFPLAYSILLPAFYIPIIMMLLGLILRGVAFEFRFKAGDKSRKLWDYAFHFGSLGASFCQGMILGAFVTGVEVEGRNFAGGPFDFATGFSVMTGIAAIFGYALLGSTWLIIKTDNEMQKWSLSIAKYSSKMVAIFMIIVSISVTFVDKGIKDFWFSMPNCLYLLPIPLITIFLFAYLHKTLNNNSKEYKPFFITIGIFLMGYIGLAISIFPWIIPFNYNIWEAAASGPGLSLMLIAILILLPIIIGYTGYTYYVFRGKSSNDHMY